MRHGNHLTQVLVPAAAALLMACSAPEAPPGAFDGGGVKIEPGRPFPDIVLPSIEDGRPMWLRQFRGRKVLLHVFASW